MTPINHPTDGFLCSGIPFRFIPDRVVLQAARIIDLFSDERNISPVSPGAAAAELRAASEAHARAEVPERVRRPRRTFFCLFVCFRLCSLRGGGDFEWSGCCRIKVDLFGRAVI